MSFIRYIFIYNYFDLLSIFINLNKKNMNFLCDSDRTNITVQMSKLLFLYCV